jgi:hypothetical protein
MPYDFFARRRISAVGLTACLVSERLKVILYASVPENTVGTDLSDGPPVFGQFSIAQRRLAREL